jgi:hypothetical protein
MIPLYALGVLDKYNTFEKPIEKNREILWYARKFNLTHNFISEMFIYLSQKKSKLIPWLYLATILGYLRYWLVKYLPPFIKRWLRKYGYFVPRNEAPDSYELHSITQILRQHDDHSPT